MVTFIFYFSILVISIVAGYCRSKTVESSSHMINAEWLDHRSKFDLIVRWGVR